MNIPQIRIESTFANIGLATEKPVQEIRQPKADLSIRQPKAELTIERTPGQLTIDQTKAWEDMNLKHIFRLIDEFAENGYRDLLRGIARRARQGDELMRIEDGGNPIVSQAIENSGKPVRTLGITWIPSSFSVKIHYVPGELEFHWKQHKPIIEAKPNKPEHHYTPGKVNVYLVQKNDLKIDFVHLNERV